jgi:hypothetical protein
MNFNSTNSGKPDASANSSRPHPALVPIGQNSSSFRRPSRVSCHTWTSPTADWLWAVGGSASISPDSTGAIDDWQWMGAYWRRGHFIHRIFGDLALHRWDYRLNCHLRRLRLVPNVGVYSSTHERAACLTAVVWLHRASCIHRAACPSRVRAAQKYAQKWILFRPGIGHWSPVRDEGRQSQHSMCCCDYLLAHGKHRRPTSGSGSDGFQGSLIGPQPFHPDHVAVHGSKRQEGGWCAHASPSPSGSNLCRANSLGHKRLIGSLQEWANAPEISAVGSPIRYKCRSVASRLIARLCIRS